MGDSFTSGPGTGDIDPYSQQCTRYSNAYVRQMNENEDLGMPGNKENRYLTHSACFGAKTDDITLFQTIPGDRDHRADHPRFGKPQLAVLTLGGNNVGFSGFVLFSSPDKTDFILTLEQDCQQLLVSDVANQGS